MVATTNEKLKMLGTLSQICPSWVRAVCRSNITYDPEEYLEEWRKYNIQRLSDSPYYDDYKFIRSHEEFLKSHTTEEVYNALSTKYRTQCPYLSTQKEWTKLKKGQCITCTLINDYLREVMNERNIPGGPVVQAAARVKR